MLPTLLSAEVDNLIAKGPTIPSIIKLGKNKINALINAPVRKPKESVAKSTGRVNQGINNINKAANAMMSDNPVLFALSDQRPPIKYPNAKAIIVTEIRDDHTYKLVP